MASYALEDDLEMATWWTSLVLENAAIAGPVVARRRQAHLAYSHPHERILLFCVEVQEWTIPVEAGELEGALPDPARTTIPKEAISMSLLNVSS